MPIFRRLKAKISPQRELYVLADTSYGSCCVDEVAAQHVDADAMVHYGHACMSQTSRLPVIYVFGRKEIDPSDCAEKLLGVVETSQLSSHILLRLDVAYIHYADKIMSHLRSALPSPQHLLYSPIPLKSTPIPDDLTRGDASPNEATPTIHLDNVDPSVTQEIGTIFWVGAESLTLTNLLMTHASCNVYSYDPSTKIAQLESARVNKLLMRRYVAVQKARDSDVFGILVGTLGVASYLPLITHLRTILQKAHKKSYTISVGKLNPAKLANFMEIECFVLVACPENSVIEAKEFYRPIVTPYELEVALQSEANWTGKYVLDFKEILSMSATEGSAEPDTTEEEPQDNDQPMFSLVTGKYRHAKQYGVSSRIQDGSATPSSAVIVRNQDNALAVMPDSAAGQFLQNRSFRGLETRIGQDAPSVLEQGRSGIARGYKDDHQ